MPLAWNDLRGLSVGVLGVGAEGLETAYRLNKLGIPFQSFTTDSQENLAELLKCQVVITSPGIPKNSAVIRNLVKNNTRVVTGLDLWLHSRDSLENVVLVSGTKGKSTTSALLCELLRAAGKTTFLCGNVGRFPSFPVRNYLVSIGNAALFVAMAGARNMRPLTMFLALSLLALSLP